MLKKIFQRKIPHNPLIYPDCLKSNNQQVAHIVYSTITRNFLPYSTYKFSLDHLLIAVNYGQKSVTHKLLSLPPGKCQSLYIYGDVGRGNDVDDVFYEACPIEQKKRVHLICLC